MPLTQSQRTILEGTTARYTGILLDESSEAIAANDLATFTLTLYEQRTKAIINGRNNQDIRNANGVTIDAEGNVEWIMEPADNAIIGTPRAAVAEKHVALFQWTWGGGKAGKHELLIEVRQLEKVT